MPLIRYRNEDLAELGTEACSCGRSLPTLAKVLGRSADIIRSPAGRLIHGEFFTHLFYDAPGVTRFQVRQASLDHLVISVVGNEQFDDRARSHLAEKIARHGDPAFRIEWRDVGAIEPGPAGKHRFTLSDLHS
jgi:phenylacetate-CoA ligase